MKTLFTAIILFFVLLTSAQKWCPQGAQWHFGENQIYTTGYETLSYINDTIINTINCKKINQYFTGTTWNTGGQVTTIYIKSHFTYEQANTVYYYNSVNNVFDTLFNFNANIGDKWLNILHPFSSCQNGRRHVTVLDTSHKMINGSFLKKLTLKYDYLSGGTIPQFYIDTIYEKIGTVRYFLFPYKCETNIILDPDLSVAAPFRCYQDNFFTYFDMLNAYTPSCNYITTIKKLDATNYIQFYPNPTTSILNIVDEQNQLQNSTLQIKNYLGQILLSTAYSNQIDLSTLSSGMYFLTIQNGNNAKSFKIMKE